MYKKSVKAAISLSRSTPETWPMNSTVCPKLQLLEVRMGESKTTHSLVMAQHILVNERYLVHVCHHPQQSQQNSALGMMSPVTSGSTGTPNENVAQCAPFINGIRLHHTPMAELKSCLHITNSLHVSSKKAVFFAPTVNMKVIPHKASFPNNEIWYSREEQKQLMEESMEVVELRRHLISMSENDFEETHNESVRGLENCLSRRLFRKHKREQEEVIAAVPFVQEKMKAKGLPIDHEVLSHVSQILSAPARERAYQIGLAYQ